MTERVQIEALRAQYFRRKPSSIGDEIIAYVFFSFWGIIFGLLLQETFEHDALGGGGGGIISVM